MRTTMTTQTIKIEDNNDPLFSHHISDSLSKLEMHPGILKDVTIQIDIFSSGETITLNPEKRIRVIKYAQDYLHSVKRGYFPVVYIHGGIFLYHGEDGNPIEVILGDIKQITITYKSIE